MYFIKRRHWIPFILLLLSTLFFKCKKDSPESSLPPATSVGANTFGCLVDGRALLPRDGVANFDVPYPHKGIEAVFGGDKTSIDLHFYNARDKLPLGFFLDIHLFDSNNIEHKEYKWQQTLYGVGYTDNRLHHLFGSFYDSETKNYAWFGSYDGSGTTIITKVDSINHIISGTFSGKLRKRDGGSKEITISNGRFDINWGTVLNKEFP